MNIILDHIERNAAEYIALIGLLAIAMIANLPTPERLAPLIGDRWLFVSYKWVYDSLQAFMAARSPHSSMSSTVTTPTSTSHVEASVVSSQTEAPAAASATFPTTKP